MTWAEHVARTGEIRNAYNILAGRPEGKRPLGRAKRRWEREWILEKRSGKVWTGCMWLSIETSGGLL